MTSSLTLCNFPSLQVGQEEEIELDIDALDENTLRQLYKFAMKSAGQANQSGGGSHTSPRIDAIQAELDQLAKKKKKGML